MLAGKHVNNKRESVEGIKEQNKNKGGKGSKNMLFDKWQCHAIIQSDYYFPAVFWIKVKN